MSQLDNRARTTAAGQATPPARARLDDVRGAARFALVCVELVLVLFVIWRYQLESRTFFDVMALGSAGFVVHALAPGSVSAPVLRCAFARGHRARLRRCRWRVAGLLGLLLIGICHLPLRLAFRISLLALTAAVFALFRSELVHGPWSGRDLAILGSMFMSGSRCTCTRSNTTKSGKPGTDARVLFHGSQCVLPAVSVVDYLSFRRNYYDRDAASIYATGTKWIVGD
jgi:hypothetical protein